ncbi:DUF6907 domain-containing protein [Aeromicrobium sp. UC242_57]|uniref:DUF6907 domain-containing protein n=1 Tax=Aeromicrobium sp. UC242_57 TaxID=3374624 RepID=UPI0037AF9B04
MQNDSTRANWQTEPCPAWCVRTHQDDDHPDDRYHDSEPTEIPAVFAERDRDAGPGQWTLDAGELTIITSRHVDTTETITFVGREDRLGHALTLTPDSAARLAHALNRHLALVTEGPASERRPQG